MKKRSLFGLFFTVVLSLLAISCSFNGTAGLSFSLNLPTRYRSTNDETISKKTADIIVYNSRTMSVVQKETFTTTTDSLNVTLEYLPVGQGLFVYARVTATVSDEQGNSRIVAWSGKSDAG